MNGIEWMDGWKCRHAFLSELSPSQEGTSRVLAQWKIKGILPSMSFALISSSDTLAYIL